MNHECYRLNSSESSSRVSFLCSCGCCGGASDRYCCDPSFCDPAGKGVYLSIPTVVALICLAVCVLIGAIVALILALRMRSRTGKTKETIPKEQEALGNNEDQQQVVDDCRQEHIAFIYGLHLQQQQQQQRQHQQQQQHNSSWREISAC